MLLIRNALQVQLNIFMMKPVLHANLAIVWRNAILLNTILITFPKECKQIMKPTEGLAPFQFPLVTMNS